MDEKKNSGRRSCMSEREGDIAQLAGDSRGWLRQNALIEYPFG